MGLQEVQELQNKKGKHKPNVQRSHHEKWMKRICELTGKEDSAFKGHMIFPLVQIQDNHHAKLLLLIAKPIHKETFF